MKERGILISHKYDDILDHERIDVPIMPNLRQVMSKVKTCPSPNNILNFIGFK